MEKEYNIYISSMGTNVFIYIYSVNNDLQAVKYQASWQSNTNQTPKPINYNITYGQSNTSQTPKPINYNIVCNLYIHFYSLASIFHAHSDSYKKNILLFSPCMNSLSGKFSKELLSPLTKSISKSNADKISCCQSKFYLKTKSLTSFCRIFSAYLQSIRRKKFL